MKASGLDQTSTSELFELFAAILRELRSRGVVRSSNNPVAVYSKFLAAKALGLELVTKSTKGHDALDTDHFDYLVGIVFNEDFSIPRACLVPAECVRKAATYRDHVNAWILNLHDSLWDLGGVKDVTEAIQATATRVGQLDPKQ